MKKKHNSQLKVVEAFKEKGIEIEILNLEVSTKTSQEAADAVNCDIKQIAKSIVFFESIQKKLVQIFVSGPNRVNLKSFENQTNLTIEKADADYVRESTGFAIGGVAPLGHKNKPLYFFDNTLVDFDEVWCAAGTPSSLFKLKTKDFIKILTQPKSALIKQYVALLEAEGVSLEFDPSSIKAISELATEVNTKTENIGARRLHTIMTTLLEQPLFEHPKKGQKKLKITAKYVKEALGDIVFDEDLSRYIL